MANRTTKNPIVIDTADTELAGPLHIKRMIWAGTEVSGKDIAAADDLTLRERVSGDIVFAFRATADNLGPFVVFEGGTWNCPNGLYVDDIDGGELTIWL